MVIHMGKRKQKDEAQKSKFDRKKRRGDRKDGWRVRNIDSYAKFVPLLMPDRDAASIFFKETVEATQLIRFVEKCNAERKENSSVKKYTYFSVFLTALARTLAMRPHLNRFVAGGRLYQRRDVKLCFVAKREMKEEAPETDVVVSFRRDVCLDDVTLKIQGDIRAAKDTESKDHTTNFMDVLMKFPTWMVRAFKGLMDFCVRHDCFPQSLMDVDAMQCSAFVSNLGSLGLENVPFHHLYDRGTCSLFLVIGNIYKDQVYVPGQGFAEKDVVDFTVTLDERVSNGMYYIKAVSLFKYYIEHPEELLRRLSEDEIPLDA